MRCVPSDPAAQALGPRSATGPLVTACRGLLVAAVLAAPAIATPDDAVIPLPAVDEADSLEPTRPEPTRPERQQTVFERIRLAALGDPQDLTEPLLPDDLAPPGQPRQEFEPPAGRKLPPGAKPGILQQALYQTTVLQIGRAHV